MYIFAAALLCTILPSQVAFFSLVSAGGVPTIAAYGLIALLRLTMTPNNFKHSHFFLGRYRKLCYVTTILFNALIVSVSLVHTRTPAMVSSDILDQGHVIPALLPGHLRNIQFCMSTLTFPPCLICSDRGS